MFIICNISLIANTTNWQWERKACFKIPALYMSLTRENELRLKIHWLIKEHYYIKRSYCKFQVLYTIANSVGAPAPGGQYGHYKEDLHLYAQRAFDMSPERHYRLLHAAGEEKPPIVVLSVAVIEADGLEAKDANGE